jgi:hypothetical protein
MRLAPAARCGRRTRRAHGGWARRLTLPRPQVVKEHYLRDDIYCGSPLAAPEHRGARRAAAAVTRVNTPSHASVVARYAPAGPDLEACRLSATPEAYLVIDSNVALHQARPRRARTRPHALPRRVARRRAAQRSA